MTLRNKKTKITNACESFVYCGPDIPGTARQYTTFKAMPKRLKAVIDKVPSIRYLLVSPEKLANTRIKIKTSGTFENIMFRRVEKQLKEREF